MSHTLRAAVIGTGSMGRHHVRLYGQLDNVDLIGIFDAEPLRSRVMAAEHSTRAFASFEELMGERPDVVTVAVPTTLHAPYAIGAMMGGAHVLVEKPIAGSIREATDMMQTARRTGRQLMVGHIERFNPAIDVLAASVAPEEILAVNIMRVGPKPPRIKDAGVIVDLAVHDIDLTFYLTGRRAEDVFCVTSGGQDSYEDTASILMKLEGGVSAQLTANWITPYKQREVQLITEDRVLRADLMARSVRVYRRDGEGCSSESLDVPDREPLRGELEAFLSAVRMGTRVPVSAEEGLRALEVAVRATAYKHIRHQRAA